MNYARRPGIDSDALSKLAAREAESFRSTHRESALLAQQSAAHWLGGVPMAASSSSICATARVCCKS